MISPSGDADGRPASTPESWFDNPTGGNGLPAPMDEDNLPELASYFSAGKLWCKFAAWPVVLCVINGVVFGTLMVYDDREFRYKRSYFVNGDQDPYLTMLRYNATVFATTLFIDAGLLYFAALFVQNDVQALDDLISEEEPTFSTAPNRLDVHFHAQVSKRLDVFLGRGNRPRVSIFVSLLLLGSSICTVFAFMSLAEYCFTWIPIAQTVCVSMEYDYFTQNDIEGIPKELQPWAKQKYEGIYNRYHLYDMDGSTDFVRLEGGTSYFVAVEPKTNVTMSNRSDDSPQFVTSSEKVLVALSANGTMDFMSNITRPGPFVGPSNADKLRMSYFCCFYTELREWIATESRESSREPSMNLLCADSTGVQKLSLEQGAMSRTQYLSLRWYERSMWMKQGWRQYKSTDTDKEYFFEYFKVAFEKNKRLRLIHVKNVTRSGRIDKKKFEMIGGQTAACRHWRKNIATVVLVTTLALTAFWLRRIRNVPVAVVPAIGALIMLLRGISNPLATAVCTVFAVSSLLALLGITVLLTASLGSEELVWVLYTSIALAVNFADNKVHECVSTVLVIYVLVGSILGHPTLYLVGWVGCIGLALTGGVFVLMKSSWGPLVYVVAGIIGGIGCITLGKLMITYRPYLRYYANRVYQAVNTRAPGRMP